MSVGEVQNHDRAMMETRTPRTSMFVMATLYAGASSAPVKVMDMSSTGVLIEGGVIPSQGAKVRLGRGAMTIVGEVVWRDEVRAGLRFESRATVDDWLPKARSVAPQQRVDEIVQQCKAAELASVLNSEPPPANVSAVELMHIKGLVEALAVALAQDFEIVRRFGFNLQCLDLAAQALGKLAKATAPASSTLLTSIVRARRKG